MLEGCFIIMFWLCITALAYGYAGYPVLLGISSLLFKKRITKAQIEPSVTMIISVYNEERVIREKLENALLLKYPIDRLEIVVASDGSTDKTHEIVREFEARGVRLFIQKERLGKTAALNMAIRETKNEIIVFTDANSMYDPDAIGMMVENFADPEVGCVTGETRLVNPEESAVGRNEMAYYYYDTFLKIKETALGSTVGADGGIFAIRREFYEPLDASLINDFVIPLRIVAKGYRVVYEPRAFLEEATATPLKGGFQRRIRIINRSLFGLFSVPEVLNPAKVGFFAVEVISRKLLRWSAPFFILVVFGANMGLLTSPFYRFTFFLQVAFYLLAGFQWVSGGKIANRYLAFPYYFCHGNVAALVAFVKFLKGERIVVWEPLRR